MDIGSFPLDHNRQALTFDYFPDPFCTVIFRNWNLVSPEHLAKVLKTTPENIRNCAQAMGLMEDSRALKHWQQRGYITLIRKNWHLLPYEQLLELLDWSPERFHKTFYLEDFLFVKLGYAKPVTNPVFYRELSVEEHARLALINQQLTAPADAVHQYQEPPFAFLESYGKNSSSGSVASSDNGLRMVYAYSALYGDPLMDSALDPYPDKLLADYAAAGVNAVWLQGVLYALTPWTGDEALSQNWQIRQEALRQLVKRAARYGIKVFLYLNEPRGLPEKEFRLHKEWMGTKTLSDNQVAFCARNPEMLQALQQGITDLCQAVPDLGGFFTISMSENLTHCLSRPCDPSEHCPRCANTSPAESIVPVLTAIVQGIKTAKTHQECIAWSWGWEQPWDADVIAGLPPEVIIMCVSENALPTCCHGISGTVNDYSISKVGPGPTARRQWQLARQSGHKIMAKVQMNNSWELSALPYLPVMQLVRQHMENIAGCGVKDFLLDWTLGGYPGGNLELADRTVTQWMERRFSPEIAGKIESITARFSKIFTNFPFHQTSLIYQGPMNSGPANLLYGEPTNRHSCMVTFPYDDLSGWCGGHFPEEILDLTFEEMSTQWQEPLAELAAFANTPNGQELYFLAEAMYCHLRSTWCQIRFIRLRNAGKLSQTIPLIEEEILLAQQMCKLVARDSRLGFEATNHYAYTLNDLQEKIINCYWLLEKIRTQTIPDTSAASKTI